MKLPLNSFRHSYNRTDISSIPSFVYFIITYIKGRMKLPLKLNRQWPRTVAKYSENVMKLPLNPDGQTMGLKIMTKSKNQRTKWQFFHENHQLGKVVEMKGIDGSFFSVGFSRTGTEMLKNWSGQCEGLGEGINGLKNRSGEWEGLTGRWGGTNSCLK